jgi:hypothetical protein
MATLESNYAWGSGHIELPWPKIIHRSLKYKREPFNDPASIKLWKSQGHTQKHFTGKLYDMKSPTPLWFAPDDLASTFNLREMGWAFYKMTTGVILPRHVDQFVRYKKLFPEDKGTIVRVLVMLEDWQDGHYLDLADRQATEWKAGDYFWWTELGPHTAANIGVADRYTLQLTGFRDF